MGKPYRPSISNIIYSWKGARYENLRRLVLAKKSTFVSQKYSLRVGCRLYTKQRRTCLKQRNGHSCLARRYLPGALSPYYLLAIFPCKCTNILLLCHFYVGPMLSSQSCHTLVLGDREAVRRAIDEQSESVRLLKETGERESNLPMHWLSTEGDTETDINEGEGSSAD